MYAPRIALFARWMRRLLHRVAVVGGGGRLYGIGGKGFVLEPAVYGGGEPIIMLGS